MLSSKGIANIEVPIAIHTPCIGLFRFLTFSISLSPIYAWVIDRVRKE